MEKLFSITTYYYYFKILPRSYIVFFSPLLFVWVLLSRKSEICFKSPSRFSHSSLYYSPSVTTHLNQLHFPYFPSVFSVVTGGYYPSLSVTFTLLPENNEEDTTWAVHRLVESKLWQPSWSFTSWFKCYLFKEVFPPSPDLGHSLLYHSVLFSSTWKYLDC